MIPSRAETKGKGASLLAWLTVAFMFVCSLVTLGMAPDEITIDWGPQGEPTGTASAAVGLFMTPLIALGLQLLAMLWPKIDPGKANFANFRPAYWRVFLAIQLYLVGVNLLICVAAVGQTIAMQHVMPLLAGSLLIVIANYLGKLRPNWIMGIRTPWTLSSKKSWDKTHRLGMWLMMGMGLSVMLLAVFPTAIARTTVGVICVTCVAVLIVYSWVVWRNDQDKVSTAGVSPVDHEEHPADSPKSLSAWLLIGAVSLGLHSPVSRTVSAADPVTASIELKTDTGTLFASLDLPANANDPLPVVLILPGSGPTDADGNSPGVRNDSLKLLGQGLATHNIAACRIDKRGIGRSQTAGFAESDLRFDNYIDDAVNWIELLNADPRFSEVHVLGHSEGSLIGMLATQRVEVASFISVAGTARPAADLLRSQLETKIPSNMMADVETLLGELESGKTAKNVPPLLNSLFRPSVQPYLISWFRHEPVEELAKLKTVPVLIVQGSTDLQCLPEGADQLAASLPSAKKVVIADMNHVLKKTAATTIPEQLPTYVDPSKPLHDDLVPAIVAFVQAR